MTVKKILLSVLILGVKLCSHAGPLDTWTKVDTTTNGNYFHIVHGNGHYVAVCFAPPTFPQGGPVLTGGISASTNGTDWTNEPVFNAFIGGIVFGNNTFVIYDGEDGFDSVLYSTNSTTWGSVSGFPTITGLAFGNGVFAAIGSNSASQGQVYLSTNGQTWTTNNFPAAGFSPFRIAYGQGLFLVAGTESTVTNNYIFSSADGKNWTNITPVLNGKMVGFSCVNDIFFVAMASNQFSSLSYYYVNTNLSSLWTLAPSPAAQAWLPTAGSGAEYVTAITTNYVLSSSDYDTNWIPHATGFTNNITCITYANGRFLAGSSDGAIFISGIVPPSVSVAKPTNSPPQVTLSGGVGPTYHLQASTNFSSWTNLASFTNIGVSAQYLDSNATKFPYRYYRTVSP